MKPTLRASSIAWPLLGRSSFALLLLAFGIEGAANAEDSSYEIQKAPTAAAVGVPGNAGLTLKGKNGWHLNEQAPITVTVKADPSVTLPKPKLVRADLTQSTKDAARFEIPFTASAPGKTTITAEARFVVCQEEACKPMKETVALQVDVSASQPGPTKATKKRAKTATP